MPHYAQYSWGDFLDDVYKKILPALKPRAQEFDGIWGPPRGGLILAVILSYELDLPFIVNVSDATEKTLIVDDIADTGKTLAPFKDKNTIVTLFYHRQSIVRPDIWVHEKFNAWIVFPWEHMAENPAE